MKYKVTLNGTTYEVEVEAGEAMLVDEYQAYAPAPAPAPVAAAAPAGATVTQMAQVYGGNEHDACSINVLTTLMCIVTMPLMVALYQM